jgi:hypothetical protein
LQVRTRVPSLTSSESADEESMTCSQDRPRMRSGEAHERSRQHL